LIELSSIWFWNFLLSMFNLISICLLNMLFTSCKKADPIESSFISSAFRLH
jgi:hypothetical protein